MHLQDANTNMNKNKSSDLRLAPSLECLPIAQSCPTAASSSPPYRSTSTSTLSTTLLQQPVNRDPQTKSHIRTIESQEGTEHNSRNAMGNEVWSQGSIERIVNDTTFSKSRLDTAQQPETEEVKIQILRDQPIDSPSGESCSRLGRKSNCKRTREETLKNLLRLKQGEIGRVVARGGLGEVLAYRPVKSETLIIKIYVHPSSFHKELRTYLKISRSNLPIPLPHFHQQVILPPSFISPRYLTALRGTYMPYFLGLVLEQLKGPLLTDVLHILDTPLRATLQRETRACLASLHQLGISHGDIKGDNIMFRTSESKDWVFIDFGEANFISELSTKAWKRACEIDRANLAAIFQKAEAQYASQARTLFLESYSIPSSDVVKVECCMHSDVSYQMLAADSVRHPDIPWPILSADFLRGYFSHKTPVKLTCYEVQRHLSCILELAIRLPKSAVPLVASILTAFPSPIPPLAKHAINILHQAGGSNYALHQLNVELSSPNLSLLFRADFHYTKITILSKCGNLDERVSASEVAIPALVDGYGERDPRTIFAKRELAELLSQGAT